MRTRRLLRGEPLSDLGFFRSSSPSSFTSSAPIVPASAPAIASGAAKNVSLTGEPTSTSFASSMRDASVSGCGLAIADRSRVVIAFTSARKRSTVCACATSSFNCRLLATVTAVSTATRLPDATLCLKSARAVSTSMRCPTTLRSDDTRDAKGGRVAAAASAPSMPQLQNRRPPETPPAAPLTMSLNTDSTSFIVLTSADERSRWNVRSVTRSSSQTTDTSCDASMCSDGSSAAISFSNKGSLARSERTATVTVDRPSKPAPTVGGASK
mmetsp:Transcript_6511/g.23210  ORF Transcript_6511/g.23210 Transcript_6511/m.23210 type:complete len:269 (-) Transcript_6511:1319-2125(-)